MEIFQVMKSGKPMFPVGATYAPLPKATEVDASQWRRDLRNFKSLGLNTFRIFICHDRVEREQGMRDFSGIDRAFDLAEEMDLKIIANIGGCFENLQGAYSARFLARDLHCALLQPDKNSRPELRGNRFRLCPDDPQFQEYAADFISEAVLRYRDRPSLSAWSGWNEPHTWDCCCPHTLNLFRRYLQEKYGSLDALLSAWGSEFPLGFRSWDEVYPQQTTGFSEGGYLPFLDYWRFTAFNLKQKFEMIRKWIRNADAETPIISHFAGPGSADYFGTEDRVGVSVYTIHAQGRGGNFPPYEFSCRLDIPEVSAGERPHRKDPEGFLVVETEAGPVAWVHDLAPRSYSAAKMNARDVCLIAHGARGVIRWLYRSRISDAQAGEFNLVGWDGSMTERAEKFGALARFLNRHGEIFNGHLRWDNRIAVLDERDCMTLFIAEKTQNRYHTYKLSNVIQAFCHIGIRPKVCNARQLCEKGFLKELAVLYIPMRPYLSAELAGALREFVARGGLLLAESPFGIKDMNGIHYCDTPGLLSDVFGVAVHDMEQLEEDTCGGIPALDFKMRLEPRGARVESVFADGSPAVTSCNYGKGRAVLYASLLSLAYQIGEPFHRCNPVRALTYAQGAAFRDELRKQLAEHGIMPDWEVADLPLEKRMNIQVILRKLPSGRRVIFILNMDDTPNTFTVMVKPAFSGESFSELPEIPGGMRCETRGNMLHISTQAWGWSVLTGTLPSEKSVSGESR